MSREVCSESVRSECQTTSVNEFGQRLQSVAAAFGSFLQRNAALQLFVGSFLLLAIAVSLKCAHFEPDLQRLWVPRAAFFDPDPSLDYVRNTFGEPMGAANLILIQTPKEDHPDVNLLEPEALLMHLDVMRVATQVSVDLFDIPWKLKDICYSLNAPDIEEYNVLQVIEKLLPCAIATPLDCFWEGAKLLGPDDDLHVPGYGHVRWTNLNPGRLLKQLATGQSGTSDIGSLHSLNQMLQRGGVSSAYQDKPCLDPTDEECPVTAPNKNTTRAPDVAAALMHGCSGFATKWLHWPQPLLLGGVRRNRTNQLTHASALQSVLQLMSESDLYEFYRNHFKVLSVDWTLDKARQVLDAWQRQLTEQLRQWKTLNPSNSNKFDLHQFTPVALIDSMRRYESFPLISIAVALSGLLLNLLLITSKLGLTKKVVSETEAESAKVASSTWLAIPCLLLLLLTFAASFGCSALIGIPFSSTTTCLAPFVAFAMIALPVHCMLYTYFDVCRQLNQNPTTIALDDLVAHVLRRSIRLQLLLTLASLSSLSIAVIVPVPALRQLILQLLLTICFTFFILFLLLPSLLTFDLTRRFGGSNVGSTKCTVNRNNPIDVGWTSIDQKSKHSVLPLNCNLSQADDTKNSTPKKDDKNRGQTNVDKSRQWIRTMALAVGLAFTLYSLLGMFELRDGLELSDVVPRSTEEHQFLRAQQQHLGVFHMHVVTTGRFDYAQNQRLLQQLHESIGQLPNVFRRPDQRPFDFWLHLFSDWLRSLQDTFDREWTSGQVHADGWHRNASADAILAYKLMVQTGRADRPVDRRLIGKRRRLVDGNGLITIRPFYNYLTAWVNSDAITYSASQASFKPEPKQWTHEPSDHDLRIPRAASLQNTQMPFLLQQLDTSERVLVAIEQVKGVCASFARLGLHSFPIGLPFLFWQQFHFLRTLFFGAIFGAMLIAGAIVAWVTGRLSMAALPIGLIAVFNVQLIGTISRLRLQLNALPAVAIIISNVIFVQSVLYQTIMMISSSGNDKQRVRQTMQLTKSVLMQKTVSIVIVISVLALSDFDYIVKYFCGILALGIAIECQLLFALQPFLLLRTASRYKTRWTEQPIDTISSTKLNGSPIKVNSIEPTHVRLRRSVRHSSSALRNGIQSGNALDKSTQPNQRKVSTRAHSQISLSTISEEPNDDYTSSREVIAQSQLVLETTTTSNAFASSFCSRVATCYTPNSDQNSATSPCETPVTTDGMCTPSTDRDSPLYRECGASSSASSSSYDRCSSAAYHSAPPAYSYPAPPQYSYPAPPQYSTVVGANRSSTTTTDLNRSMPDYERPEVFAPPSRPNISLQHESPSPCSESSQASHNSHTSSHNNHHELTKYVCRRK